MLLEDILRVFSIFYYLLQKDKNEYIFESFVQNNLVQREREINMRVKLT